MYPIDPFMGKFFIYHVFHGKDFQGRNPLKELTMTPFLKAIPYVQMWNLCTNK
jgi:hypothetical protein